MLRYSRLVHAHIYERAQRQSHNAVSSAGGPSACMVWYVSLELVRVSEQDANVRHTYLRSQVAEAPGNPYIILRHAHG